MANCTKCKQEVDHIRWQKNNEWLCMDCVGAKHVPEGMAKVFQPYDLMHGAKDLIPDTDPNKKLHYTKEGKRVADLDTIRINSTSEEKRYHEMMGTRQVEPGEVIQGIDAPLKPKPAKRSYFFSKKSCCST